jgi:phosphoribosylformylglycinamidine synthase
MNFGIVQFPGSNCDHDAFTIANKFGKGQYLWHKDTTIPSEIECVILPGGFSYGDYLRCGAVARFSPIMNEVIKFANSGKYVFGICNGFQILTECNLVPGALVRNENLSFICKDVYLRTENNETRFTNQLPTNMKLRIPIAHGEGNFIVSNEQLKELEDNNQIAFRYVNENNQPTKEANPNGSVSNIAGVFNKQKNVMGMMPHPERYSDKLLGCDDGATIFESIITHFKGE